MTIRPQDHSIDLHNRSGNKATNERHKLRQTLVFALGMVMVFLVIAGPGTAQKRPSRSEMGPDQPGEDEDLNRQLWEYSKKTPYRRALQHVAQARQSVNSNQSPAVSLPNGWKINPVGTQVEVGRLPYEVVSYAGMMVVLNTGYYSRNTGQEVSIVNPDSGQVVKILRFSSMFPSAQEGLDGDLYISGGFSRRIYRVNRDFKTVREYKVSGYTSGLAAMDSSHVAVAYLVAGATQEDLDKGRYTQGKLAIINTVSGAVEHEVTVGYFPQTVRYVHGKLYAALLGEDKLGVFDAQLNPLQTLSVGRTPQDICSAGDKLYVVNSGADNVSVVDTGKDVITSTIELKRRGAKFGSGPTSCAVDGELLYVTEANTNAVAVWDTRHNEMRGYIPTAWYPTKVITRENRIAVLSAKGIHPRRPNVDGPQPVAAEGGPDYVLTLLRGALSIIPKNTIASSLSAWTKQVEDGSPLYNPAEGLKLPIKHIFYIVRENRSYDQIMGDLGRGNGDSYLTTYGREVTPIGHQLADEFVTLDNYFADGEVSVLGHSFTTSGYVSPFLLWLGNASYSGRYAAYPFGSAPAATSPAYLWDALDDKGIDYRIYGENYFLYTRAYRILVETLGADSEITKKFHAQMMSLASATDRGKTFYDFANSYYGQSDTVEAAATLLEDQAYTLTLSRFLCGDDSLSKELSKNPQLRQRFASYVSRYPGNYRSWDLSYSDLQRVQAWKMDFQKQVQSGKVAQLHYIWLPNDHTAGVDKNYLPPDQLIAQNDTALGMIIETISRSAVWNDSLILVTEDDAQNGPDHVDATRSVFLAAGPYVKRKAVVSDRYDQLSLLRTIELILGLSPINLNDNMAVPMFGIFDQKADSAPYLPTRPSSHLAAPDLQLYQALVGK